MQINYLWVSGSVLSFVCFMISNHLSNSLTISNIGFSALYLGLGFILAVLSLVDFIIFVAKLGDVK